MQTSVPGNSAGNDATRVRRRGRRQRGFTLIELVVVLAIVAIGAALVSLAIRDPASTRLDADAARLVALLEMARSEARAGGLNAVWAPHAVDARAAAQAAAAPPGSGGEFQFVGLPPSLNMPTHWLDERVSATVVGGTAVRLGPEAILPAQRIVLQLESQRLDIATDGLAAFAVVETLPDTAR